MGILALVSGLPAAWLIRQRTPVADDQVYRVALVQERQFHSLVCRGSHRHPFPLLVPAFFLPAYGNSIGLSSSTSAALLAGFNFASALGRVLGGVFADKLGPLNSLFVALVCNAVSMLALWPASTSLAPLAAFAVINGASNGWYFATIPTVIGNIFGSARVSVALGMIFTGWGAGYLMVSFDSFAYSTMAANLGTGSSYCRLSFRRVRRDGEWAGGISPSHVLRWIASPCICWPRRLGADAHELVTFGETITQVLVRLLASLQRGFGNCSW